MAIKIRLLYSTTASAVPTAANMITGEIAINTADRKAYVKDTAVVKQLLGATGPTGATGAQGATGATGNASDYRLKKNIEKLQGSLTKINALNPVTYSWISSDKIIEGFIAHEVQNVVPNAVTGAKDGVEIQTLDQTKLIPIIVGAIQELQQIMSEIKNGN